MKTQMSLSDRISIQRLLDERKSFKAIGKVLNRDCNTIRNEIKNNQIITKRVGRGRTFNNCANRITCDKYGLCDKCVYSRRNKCAYCPRCSSLCHDFKEEICPKLSKPPYVCNGCKLFNKCSLLKHEYIADKAQEKYIHRLSNARQGIQMDEDDIFCLNNLLGKLIKDNGQSLHHVCINHADEVMVCERTLYTYVEMGLLPNVRNIDLPRKVRYRGRSKEKFYKVDKNYLEDRKYEDYIEFISKHPEAAVVELDSVEGKKGESCLLTIHFVKSEFMLAFKRERNDSKSVTDVFNAIYDMTGHALFTQLFPVILADNGSEFTNPSAIEFDKDGNRRTYMFYCHPSSPYEKGACEVNHELIRRVVPKGTSWDQYTQKDINVMMSHVNSYARGNLNNKPPYLLFTTMYSKDLADIFGISCIDADDIKLRPTLLNI